MSRIAPLDAATEESWERFVETHPRAGIYHSLAWRAVTCDGLGHDPRYLCAKNGSGDVVGVLPLFDVKGFGGRRLVSVPMRDRGGPVGRDPGIERDLLVAAIDLARELDAGYLDVRTLNPLAEETITDLPLLHQQYWVTSRVDLRGGSDAAWKSMHQRARQGVRKATEQRVVVEMDSSREAVGRFFDAFVQARTALGIPPFPRVFFDAIWRHLISAGRANLFIASDGPTIMNGLINLLSKDTVIAAYAAQRRTSIKLFSAELIYWQTIAWGAKERFATFDFGADSPAQEGLMAFKRKFGATSTVMSAYYFLYRSKAPPNFDSSTGSYVLARRLWSWLPDSLSRVGGAWVTRHLS